MKKHLSFSRRGPDYVSEELVSVLSEMAAFEFKALFLRVHANLRARNAASGGEDMLRLRAYEKLQVMVRLGAVVRTGKEYLGVAAGLSKLSVAAAEVDAKLVEGKLLRPPALVIEKTKLSPKQPRPRKALSTTPSA